HILNFGLFINQGSSSLVEFVKTNTKIPVLGHAEGICHIYLDAKCDMRTVLRIVIDSKCDYPAACNAAETILVHQDFLHDKRIHELLVTLRKNGVKVFGGP